MLFALRAVAERLRGAASRLPACGAMTSQRAAMSSAGVSTMP